MRVELTIRGIIIGVVLTLVLTAANVYCGLKAGLTFSTSIPAAVISMAILRSFRDATVQENNIVQTVASAAGTLSSIIFVLPGLIMIGWWTGFPFWISFAICALGGILGVMYSIPLRRALVTGSDLPYPEGRCLRRSTEGRQWRRCQERFGHRTWTRRSVGRVMGIDRCSCVCNHRCHANVRRRRRADLPNRP